MQAELELKTQIKHEHALSLEAFHEKLEWVPHWGTVFDKRSAQVLRHFDAAKERCETLQRWEKNPLHVDVKQLCTARMRVSVAMWPMRARVKATVRLTGNDAAFLTKSARRFIARFAQEAIEGV